jgi:hypothetical protein
MKLLSRPEAEYHADETNDPNVQRVIEEIICCVRERRLRRLHVVDLRVHVGMLEPGLRRRLNWKVGGRPAGSIGIVITERGIHLRYRLTLGDGTDVDEFVPFATPRTNFGAIRQWLTCLHYP